MSPARPHQPRSAAERVYASTVNSRGGSGGTASRPLPMTGAPARIAASLAATCNDSPLLRLTDRMPKSRSISLGLDITRLRIRTVSGVQTAGISRPMYPDRFPESDVEHTCCTKWGTSWSS